MGWIVLAQGASVVLQSTLLWRWLPAGALPDGALVLTVLWGASRGWEQGLVVGLVAGLMNSWVSVAPPGVLLVSLGAVGAGAGIMGTRFHRGSIWPLAGLVVAATVIAFVLTILALQTAGWPPAVSGASLLELAGRSLLNALLALLVLPLVAALTRVRGEAEPAGGAA